MNISEVRAVERKHQKCTLCDLSENRIYTPHFGMGHPEGKILIVLPEPYIGPHHENQNKQLYDTSPIQKNHRLTKPFDSLMKAAGISKLDTYIISTIMCPVKKGDRPSKDQVLACKPRLLETISTFNPKILVLCGPIAYFSWYEKLPENVDYGVLYNNDNKIIYYTRSIDNFVDIKRSKEYNEEQVADIKNTILEHWLEIKKLSK